MTYCKEYVHFANSTERWVIPKLRYKKDYLVANFAVSTVEREAGWFSARLEYPASSAKLVEAAGVSIKDCWGNSKEISE